MNAPKEKGPLRNFNFAKEADDRLLQLKEDTGRDMTKILEDYLLGRRQFRPEIELFLKDEKARTNRTREEIIEAALTIYMREPKRADTYTANDRAVDVATKRALEGATEQPEAEQKSKPRPNSKTSRPVLEHAVEIVRMHPPANRSRDK